MEWRDNFLWLSKLIIMFVLRWYHKTYVITSSISFSIGLYTKRYVIVPKAACKTTFPFMRAFIFPYISLRGDFEAYMRRGGVYLEELMHVEARRLKSFWGVSINNSPLRLAASGFYATGDGDEARCYSCGKRHRHWRRSQEPQDFHKSDCKHKQGHDHRNVPFNENPLPGDVQSTLPVIRNDHDIHNPYPMISGPLPPRYRRQASQQHRSILSRNATEFLWRRTRILGQGENGSNIEPDFQSGARHPQHRDITRRFCSFLDMNRPHACHPRELADAGFFYAGQADTSVCFFCGVGLRGWKSYHDPYEQHARYQPNCPFIIHKRQERQSSGVAALGCSTPGPTDRREDPDINVPHQDKNGKFHLCNNQNPGQHENGSDIEPDFQSGARHPQHRDITSRLCSFLDMNRPHARHPWELANAGFFYAGHADTSVCFFCGVGLRGWKSYHDPYEQHARYQPNCPFIIHKIQERQSSGVAALGCSTPGLTDRREDPDINVPHQEENGSDETQHGFIEEKCKICLDGPADIVFLPCSHLVVCRLCAPALNKCPVCRVVIRGMGQVVR